MALLAQRVTICPVLYHFFKAKLFTLNGTFTQRVAIYRPLSEMLTATRRDDHADCCATIADRRNFFSIKLEVADVADSKLLLIHLHYK